MIVRILTARVPEEQTNAVHASLRQTWLPAIRSQPGLVYAKLARRLDGEEERLMLISEWRTVADLYRWAGEIDGPRLAEGIEPTLTDWKVELLESLDALPEDPIAATESTKEA